MSVFNLLLWGQVEVEVPVSSLPPSHVFFMFVASGGLYFSIYITVYSPIKHDSGWFYRQILSGFISKVYFKCAVA